MYFSAYGLRIWHKPHRQSEGQGKIGRILEGLSFMDGTSILVSSVIGLIIMIGLIFFLKWYYKHREIIIALDFDDQTNQLTVTSKRIDGQEFTRTHKYAELLLEYQHLSDGMTSPMYNTITLVKDKYLVGHVYVNHFTWDETVLREIRMKLKTVCR